MSLTGISKRALTTGLALFAVFAVATAIAVVRVRATRSAQHLPVVAYLIPVDASSTIQRHWWQPAASLSLPLAVRYGETFRLPADSRVTIVLAASGETSLRTGPARLAFTVPPAEDPGFLDTSSSSLQLLAQTAAAKTRSAITITSPVGVTRFLNPLLTWTTRADTDYDVAVLDPADNYVPPRVAKKVRPPILLADLETPQRRQLGADRNYEVVLREADANWIAATARVLTLPDAQLEAKLPGTPSGLALEAISAMAQKPYRTGDAWLALNQLPPDWKKSELGLRLRLLVAAQLGLKDELLLVLDEASTPVKP